MEKLANYASGRLVSVKKTNNYLEKANNTTDQSISFKFKVKPDYRKLILRGLTFAQNFETHGYLDLAKILKVYDEDVEQLLFEIFIYSYVKCLHNSLFNGNLDSEDDFGYCFIGHSQLYHLLKRSYYQDIKEDIFIGMQIELGSLSDRRIMISLLLKMFPFLEKRKSVVSNLGLYPFTIPYYEKKLSYLVENYYVQRSNGEQVNTTMNDQESDANSADSTSAVSRTRNSGSNIDEAVKGRLEIVKMRNNVQSEIQKFSFNPILNAFSCPKSKQLYYTEVNGNFGMLFNNSFHFNLAHDIVLSNYSEVRTDVLKHYRKRNYNEELDFMVASEVYTSTGIKCRFVVDNSSFKVVSPLDGKNLDELLTYLKSFPDKLKDFIGVLETIDEWISNLDIDPGEPEGK